MFTPKFTITPEINSRIAKIERIRALIERTSILPELEVHLRFRASVESAHSSTSIEGNPLSEIQVQNVIQGKTIHATDYAITEVLNYKHALDWIEKFDNKSQRIILNDVLTIHKLVMNDLLPHEKTGQFRPGPIYIVNEDNGKETIEYVGPKAKHVKSLINSLLKWFFIQLNSSIHPILLAGLIHYLFVSIHPFSDGNGRTTRLLTLLILRTFKFDFRGTVSLDSYYRQNQAEYYQALSRSNTFEGRMSADITPFLDFFTKGFLNSVESLQQYTEIGQVANKHLPLIRLNQDELTILDFTHQFGSIALQDVVAMLSMPKRTAQRRLQALVEKNILRQQGTGPSTKYILIRH